MNDSEGRVTIRRTAPKDIQERELYVSLDGQPNHILRFGDTVTLSAAPGRHRLRVHNTISRKVAEFELGAGEHVRFSAANVRGKGYALTAVFFGFAMMHTELHREEAVQGMVGPPGIEPGTP